MNVLLTVFLVGGFAMANELEVSESIFALGTTLTEANSSFENSCKTWKTSLTSQLGTKALYLSCGAKKNQVLQTQQVRTECGNYSAPEGGTVYECYDYYTPAGVYGYLASSESKLLLTIEGEAKQIKEEISGEFSFCKVAELTPCLEAKMKARTSFDRECQNFKENARSAFGSRLIYATCGIPINSKGKEVGTEFLYDSKGIIYYL